MRFTNSERNKNILKRHGKFKVLFFIINFCSDSRTVQDNVPVGLHPRRQQAVPRGQGVERCQLPAAPVSSRVSDRSNEEGL